MASIFSSNSWQLTPKMWDYSFKEKWNSWLDTEENPGYILYICGFVFGLFYILVLTYLFPTQAHLPEIKVHAYFAPVTPPPSVHGGGQRLCRCCIILWQWRARGGHLCLQVLLLWYGLKCVGGGHQGRWRGEEGLDPLTAPDHWSIHRLIATDPWSVEPAPPFSSCSPISIAAAWVWAWRDGWKEQWWMDLCSLSVSFSLSHCKDKKQVLHSILLLTHLTPHLWV